MKHFIQTLAGKITFVILLIIIPFLILIYQNNHNEKKAWHTEQLTKIEEKLALCSSSTNNTFQLLEETLLYLPISNNSFDQLVLYSQQDTQKYWTLILNIKEQCKSIQSIYPFMENIFVYYPEQNFFMNDQINPEMTAVICSLTQEKINTSFKLWHTVSTNKGYYLYWLYPCAGYILGAWTSYDALLSNIQQTQIYSEYSSEEETSSENQYFLTDLAGNVLTSHTSDISLDRNTLGNTYYKGNILCSSVQALHPGIYIGYKTSSAFYSPVHWYSLSFIFLIVLCLLLIFCIVFAISRWVLVPIKDMIGGIEEIASGNISYRFSAFSRTSLEFQKIENEFNHMMDQVKKMQTKLYAQELQQKETKLRYLSQQIQPHFILNSLNTLYTYSTRDVDATRKIIKLLSKYYRYVVNVESKYVCLGQELEHIENFLHLQKIRFPQKLNYKILCEKDTDIVPIPPFLLESFIGNSMKYGQDEEDQINIQIQVVQIEPFVIRITVSDKGFGFPDEILEAVQSYYITHEKNEHLGTGIYNCMERLSLIYESKAQIRCYNTVPHGAVVEITIHLNSFDNLMEENK